MKFFYENVWVWAGTALVLITLSGQTRIYGLMISGTAAVLQLILSVFDKDSE
jgi:hypothetical protein